MSRLVGGVIAAGAAGLGLVGAGVVKGIAGEDHSTRDDSGAIVEGGEVGAFRIRVGDCLAAIAFGAPIESVDAVPCSEPHSSEVYGAFNILTPEDAAFPGTDSINAQADDGCYSRFAGFVGFPYERSVYDISSITPTKDSWEQLHDREVLCLVVMTDNSLMTGSAKDTNR
jgi:hypothetical protein